MKKGKEREETRLKERGGKLLRRRRKTRNDLNCKKKNNKEIRLNAKEGERK